MITFEEIHGKCVNCIGYSVCHVSESICIYIPTNIYVYA